MASMRYSSITLPCDSFLWNPETKIFYHGSLKQLFSEIHNPDFPLQICLVGKTKKVLYEREAFLDYEQTQIYRPTKHSLDVVPEHGTRIHIRK